jgi:tripartite-type tricarboxylate transporter receptor subunit TctC
VIIANATGPKGCGFEPGQLLVLSVSHIQSALFIQKLIHSQFNLLCPVLRLTTETEMLINKTRTKVTSVASVV